MLCRFEPQKITLRQFFLGGGFCLRFNVQLVHNAQMLSTVASVQCVTRNLGYLPGKKNSRAIVVPLNITWNLIYAKSQGNQSVLGAEWLSSLEPLTGRDVASQERS